MSITPTSTVLAQLDALIAKFEDYVKHSKQSDFSDTPEADCSALVAGCLAAIYRIIGSAHPYYANTKEELESLSRYHISKKMAYAVGPIKALRNDIANGHLVTLQELVHTEMFSDFLDMAEYFLESGYKDPAAVLIGGVLEEHLRKLCVKNAVDPTVTSAKGEQPKRADSMNADLAKAGIYSILDQKAVINWLDLRNKAAHGHYSEYNADQVKNLLNSVKEFIARNPA